MTPRYDDLIEREAEARKRCALLGIDPDEVCADGGVLAWMVVDKDTRAITAPSDGEKE